MDALKVDLPPAARVVGTLDEIALGFLLDDVRRFIDTLYVEIGQASVMRRGGEELDEVETFRFFRSKERADTLKVLLQYLVAFAGGPPRQDEDGPRAFAQFRDFCHAYLGLLDEEDVRAAARREMARAGLTASEAEAPLARERAELSGLLGRAVDAGNGGYRALFAALQRYCLFWFRLRGFRFERSRRSDFFIYTLARLLQEGPGN